MLILKSWLKTELMLFSKVLLRALSLSSLISQEEIHATFQETHELLEVVTTSISTAEAEKCCSMLKRIKIFLRNSMKEEGQCISNAIRRKNKREEKMDFDYRVV